MPVSSSFHIDMVRRKAAGATGGPRDTRFCESILELVHMLHILGAKSESLDNTLLQCYQARVDILTEQVKETLKEEGIVA